MAKYTEFNITKLKTWADCDDAIESIEADYRNYIGGKQSWMSGRKAYLLKAAQTKIAGIKAKMDKLSEEFSE